MTWILTISGEGPSADVSAAAGDAFRALAELAGATSGSLTGLDDAGAAISATFQPEPEPEPAAEDDPASSPD